MKNKKFIFVLIGILVVCFIGAYMFFALLRGISAANKQQEYFDVYRDKAVEYIKSDTEMLNKYGDSLSVKFDGSGTYRESGERGFLINISKFLHLAFPTRLRNLPPE